MSALGDKVRASIRRYIGLISLIVLGILAWHNTLDNGFVYAAAPLEKKPAPLSGSRSVYKIQGRLVDANGDPVSGTHLVDFKLRVGGEDGRVVWEESHYVRVKDGVYRTELGNLSAIPSEGFGLSHLSAEAPLGGGIRPVEIALLEVQELSIPIELPPLGPAVEKKAPRVEPPAKPKAEPVKTESVKKPAPKPPAKPSLRPASYVVQPGDNLFTISEKLYGTRKRWKDLYLANEDKMGFGGLVEPGLTLIVP